MKYLRDRNPATQRQLEATLLRASLLSGIPDAEVVHAAKHARGFHLEEDDQLWPWLDKDTIHHDHDHDLAVVLSGSLKIESPRRQSQKGGRLFRIVKSSNILGVTTCIGSATHSVRVAAREAPTVVYLIPGDEMRTLAGGYPVLFQRALQHATMLVETLNLMLDADSMTLRRRTLSILRLHGRKVDDDWLEIELTWQELADLLASGKPQMRLVLGKLVQQGLVKRIEDSRQRSRTARLQIRKSSAQD
jgi:CRP-like cAMP-binding protein